MVWDNVVGGQNPPRKGCSRAILRRQRNKLKARKRWERQVEGVQGHLLHVVRPKKLHRALAKPGLAC